MKTNELTGSALDWAVAKCEGTRLEYGLTDDERYSTNWAQGGPIIEREKIETRHDGRQSWCAWINGVGAVHGPTPLIAAMRCYVASKLGDEVEVPTGLL